MKRKPRAMLCERVAGVYWEAVRRFGKDAKMAAAVAEVEMQAEAER